jgi:hypothetical protein
VLLSSDPNLLPITTGRWIIIPLAIGFGLAWANWVFWRIRKQPRERAAHEDYVVEPAAKPNTELTMGDWALLSVFLGILPAIPLFFLNRAWHPFLYVSQVWTIAWSVCLFCVILVLVITSLRGSRARKVEQVVTGPLPVAVVDHDDDDVATTDEASWRDGVWWFVSVLLLGMTVASIKMGTTIGYIAAAAFFLVNMCLNLRSDLRKSLAKLVHRRNS